MHLLSAFLVVFCLVAAVAAWHPENDVISEYLDDGSRVCKTLIPGKPLSACPPSNCPEVGDLPQANANCGMPDCRLFVSQSWLWPSVDPNFYYQCRPVVGGWEALRRPCGCMTLFDYKEQRCVHPHEFTPLCNGSPASPIPVPCPVVCLDCDGNKITGPTVGPTVGPTNPTVAPTTRPPVSTFSQEEPTTQGPNNCQCPCAPCVWWPCKFTSYSLIKSNY